MFECPAPTPKLVEFASVHFTTPEVTMMQQTTTPTFADVLNSYMNNVVHEFYTEPAEFKQMEKVIHSHVSNLRRRENTSETKIYKLLDELHPHMGNHLSFMKSCYKV